MSARTAHDHDPRCLSCRARARSLLLTSGIYLGLSAFPLARASYDVLGVFAFIVGAVALISYLARK